MVPIQATKTSNRDTFVAADASRPLQLVEAFRRIASGEGPPAKWSIERLTFRGPLWTLEGKLEEIDNHVKTAGAQDLNLANRVEWVLTNTQGLGKLTGHFQPGIRWLHVQYDGTDSAVWNHVNAVLAELMPDETRLAFDEERAKQYRDMVDTTTTAISNFRAEAHAHKTDAANELAEAKKQLETLTKTYDEHMALQAPVKYWEDLAAHYSKRGNGRSVLAWLVGLGLAGGLVLVAVGLADEFPDTPPPYWLLFAILLIAGLLIWVLRLLARGFVSDRHLAEEARTRAIMTKTYLALLRKGEAEETDRRLVLENIYRPFTTGLIGEETPPVTLVEIARALQRK